MRKIPCNDSVQAKNPIFVSMVGISFFAKKSSITSPLTAHVVRVWLAHARGNKIDSAGIKGLAAIRSFNQLPSCMDNNSCGQGSGRGRNVSRASAR